MKDITNILNNIYLDWKNSKNPDLRFIFLLRHFKFLPGFQKQGKFLEAYYALNRGIDNIIDGDVALDENICIVDFVNKRITFLEEYELNNEIEPVHEYDNLIKYCIDLGYEFNEEGYIRENRYFFSSLLFDAKRRTDLEEDLKFFYKEKLYTHFFKLDISGTVTGNLKLFKESPEKYEYLTYLGYASRIWFNVRDFAEDLVAGYVNISLEDMADYDITPYMLKQVRIESNEHLKRLNELKPKTVQCQDEINTYYKSLPKQVKDWLVSQSNEGLKLFEKHNIEFPKGNFNMISKYNCIHIYEKPAKKYFNYLINLLSET